MAIFTASWLCSCNTPSSDSALSASCRSNSAGSVGRRPSWRNRSMCLLRAIVNIQVLTFAFWGSKDLALFQTPSMTSCKTSSAAACDSPRLIRKALTRGAKWWKIFWNAGRLCWLATACNKAASSLAVSSAASFCWTLTEKSLMLSITSKAAVLTIFISW